MVEEPADVHRAEARARGTAHPCATEQIRVECEERDGDAVARTRTRRRRAVSQLGTERDRRVEEVQRPGLCADLAGPRRTRRTRLRPVAARVPPPPASPTEHVVDREARAIAPERLRAAGLLRRGRVRGGAAREGRRHTDLPVLTHEGQRGGAQGVAVELPAVDAGARRVERHARAPGHPARVEH